MSQQPMKEFGPLMPDLPDRDNPGLERAENVTPLIKGYGPARDWLPDADPLVSPCRGAAPMKDFTGNVFNYAGDTSQLYERSSNTYIVKGTGYDLGDSYRWTFKPFNGKAYACGGYGVLQEAVMGSDFADVVTGAVTRSGPAPQALYMDVVRQFIVTGNQVDNPQGLRWSALADATIWNGPSVTDPQQSGEQTLQQGGAIHAVIGGEYGIIMCQRAIYRMTYQGAPIVFSIDNVAPGKGTLAPHSVVQIGFLIYYLDVDGFYVFDGSQAVPIGSKKFNRTFTDEMYNAAYPRSIVGIADTRNTLIYWSFVSQNSSEAEGICDQIVVYNWTTKEFSGPIKAPSEHLVYSLTSGILSDDAPVGPTDSDTGPYADILSDAEQFRGGGNESVAGFTTKHRHATPSGDVLEALLETGEYSLNPGGFAQIREIRPVVDGAENTDASIAIGSRNQTYGEVGYTGWVRASGQYKTGGADFRRNARYHRLRVKVSGDFSKLIGFEPEFLTHQKR